MLIMSYKNPVMKKWIVFLYFFFISVYSTGQTFQKIFGGSSGEFLEGHNAIEQTANGGIIIVGSTSSFGVGSADEIGRACVGKECRSRWSPYHEKKK